MLMRRCVLILMYLSVISSFLFKYSRIVRNNYALSGVRQLSKHAEKGSSDVDSSDGVRINKCITGMSRRAADKCIDEGRVTINGRVATPGSRVTKGAVVLVDGIRQNWAKLEDAKASKPNQVSKELIYLKYWKPIGVTCTADISDRSNIISAGGFDSFSQRLFTVGRLDKDSTGLVLLTSDGRVNVAMLNHANNVEKVC